MNINIGSFRVFLILIEIQSYLSRVIFGLCILIVYYIIVLGPKLATYLI